MSKKSEQRQDAIIKQLIEEGSTSVRELSETFGVSQETIRQDLSKLENLGLCARTHGGATLTGYSEVSIDYKASEHASEKNRIARTAVNFIPDGSQIWIGPGSTLSCIVRYLPLRKDLTIITNSLDLAEGARATKHEVLFLGGRVQKKGSCTTGAFAMENLSHLRIDLALIGCDGFSGGDGPTVLSFEEMEIKRSVLKKAKQKILVCDSSKFLHTGSYIFAKNSDFDLLITDCVPPDAQKLLDGIGEIILAD